MTRIATVIRCGDKVGQLYSTLRSVERQIPTRGEIIVVTDPSTPPAAREWLSSMARARAVLNVHAGSGTPGAARNAGIGATSTPYVTCIDAGDCLEAECLAVCEAALDGDASVAAVAPWMRVLGPAALVTMSAATRTDLDAVLESPDAINPGSPFRREAWDALGGFDDTLGALDDYDFWLRLLASGRRVGLIPRSLIVRHLRRDALYRREWGDERYAPAMEQIVRRHASLFGRDAARVLFSREAVLQELAVKYANALARRDHGIAQLDVNTIRAAEIAPTLTDQPTPFSDFRRTTPLSRNWGYDRGVPVDRRYIEAFLTRAQADIRGTVLEVQEADYAARFGGDRVRRIDVVDLNPGNTRATIVSDLRCAANISSDTYDCIILTQTLHIIDDMNRAVAECHRILRPGGVLLATLPCASRVCLEYGDEGDFWRVTEAGARKLFADTFGHSSIDVKAHGNVLVSAAFLYGLGAHELSDEEFEAFDPYFPLLVTVRAAKSHEVTGSARRASDTRDDTGAAILLYHRVAGPRSDIHGLSVTPEDFRNQMRVLRDRYRPTALATLVTGARDGQIPRGAVAITLDDGYRDNLSHASPILMEFGIPATFFVTTDRLDEEYEFWWDALEESTLMDGAPWGASLSLELPDGRESFAMRTPEERLRAHGTIYEAIVGADAKARCDVVAAARRWRARPLVSGETRRLTAAELRILADRDGHTIGAHSARHLMLTRQPPTVLRDEITGSRKTLEGVLNRSVTAFAYPFGAFDDMVVAEVRSAGFASAVTCEETTVRSGVDPLRLPRLDVARRGAESFGTWLARQFRISPM